MRGDSPRAEVFTPAGKVLAGDTIDTPGPRPASLEAGTRIGRYVVLAELGRGSMGVVYSAWDPKLERRIAVKLLPSDNGPYDSIKAARLIREAKAMAQLSHRNVVAVHDADVHERGVFVAMEFIDGGSLRGWLDAEKRPWPAILEVFLEAGRGLAAAHRAGIVHRDFKPDNVLVGSDGRVCVADFGLAAAPGQRRGSARSHAVDGRATIPTSAETTHESGESPWRDNGGRLTRTDRSMGTPAYMSPEQHLAAAVDARADQFSFCAALYEALFGQLPFPGKEPDAYQIAVVAGNLREPPRDSPVPTWLRRVVQRGLSRRSADRYPDMGALLSDLAGDGRKRRRMRGALALVGTAGVIGLVGAAALAPASVDPCESAERHLEGVWDPARRESTRAAFDDTDLPFAASSWQAVAAELDEYTQAWTSMRREACEATHVHREQSSDLLDKRMACLDARLRRVRAQVDLFERADLDVVSSAVSAVEGLEPLDECANAELLLGREPEPTGERKDALAAADAALAEGASLHHAGKLDDAAARLEEALAAARTAGSPRLEARIALQIANLELDVEQDIAAREPLLVAIELAERAGDDGTRAMAQAKLAVLSSAHLHLDDGALLVRQADAAAARAGSSESLLAVIDYDAAVALRRGGRLAEGIRRAESAVARRRNLHGPDSIELAAALDLLGVVLDDAGETAQAIRHHEEALAIYGRRLGEEHPYTLRTWMNLGVALVHVRRFDEARDADNRALAGLSAIYGRHSPRVATAIGNLAIVENLSGNVDAALHLHREQVAILERLFPGDDVRVGDAIFNMAVTLQAARRFDEAAEAYRRALTILRVALAEGDSEIASAELGLGEVLLEQGQREHGIALIEAALPHLERNPGDLAEARWWLARAIESDQPERAGRLAGEAAAEYRSVDDLGTAETIEAWLRERPGLK